MLAAYRYRGRHRAPTPHSSVAARVAVAAAVVSGAPMLAPPANAHGILDVLAQCESGGDPRAENPTSSAAGKWQMITSTWAAYGGREFAPRASGASEAEQRVVAERLYAAEGTRPWNASRSCWAGKVGASTAQASTARPESPPAPRAEPAAGGRVVDERAADGSGRYTCTPAKLYFEACDPDTLGEVVAYPPFKTSPTGGTHTVVRGETLVRIAAEHGTTWRALHAANLDKIADPSLIFPGQLLTLP